MLCNQDVPTPVNLFIAHLSYLFFIDPTKLFFSPLDVQVITSHVFSIALLGEFLSQQIRAFPFAPLAPAPEEIKKVEKKRNWHLKICSVLQMTTPALNLHLVLYKCSSRCVHTPGKPYPGPCTLCLRQ